MTTPAEALLILQAEIGESPEAWQHVLKEHPDWVRLLSNYLEQLGASTQVSVEGFRVFYEAIYDRPLPDIDIPIVQQLTKAFYQKTGVMIESWRGKGKTTLLVAWAAYLVGCRPVGSTALIRVNDNAAKKSGKAIAKIIETNPGWLKIFPHVIPDKDAGWSSESGYYVKDSRVENYGDWLQMCFADHTIEPSLMVAGVTSGDIIGLHPTNGMWFDDLHDERNTRSAAEMLEITDMLKGNIIPTWFGSGGSPALGVACTPWSEKDAYNEMMKTGLFEKVSIPIFVRQIPENHPCTEIWKKNKPEYFEPFGTEVVLTWPEAWPMEKILKAYNANIARFGQMYLLDLSSLKGLTLKADWLGEYEREKIGENWPVFFGIDFASTTDKLSVGDTDYFALAIGKALPWGGIVCVGGFRDRLPMHEAIAKVQALASIYNPVAIGVEKFGSGRQFIETLSVQTHLPIIPLPLKGTRVLSKGQRYEEFLANDFANGRIWVSDVKDEFLKVFCDEWISWDGGLMKSRTGHDDTLDAMFYLREVAQGHVNKLTAPGVERQGRRLSPFATIGTQLGR